MWLTELWLYTTTGPDEFDDSDQSDVVLRVGYLEERRGWREWTFPLDHPNYDDRERDQTDLYRLVFGPDDASCEESLSNESGVPEVGSTVVDEFVEPPLGPWLGSTTSLADGQAELARMLITLEYRNPDRWSLRHYTLVAQVSYIEELPVESHPKRASHFLSAKTLLAHGEDLGPDSERSYDRRGIDLSSDQDEGHSLFILTPNAGRFVIVTPEGVGFAKA